MTGAALLLAALPASAQTMGGPAGHTKVYVAEEESDAVSVFEARRPPHFGYQRTVVPLSGKPHAIQLSPDGRWAWVTASPHGEETGDERPACLSTDPSNPRLERKAERGQLWVIDTRTDRAIARIPVGRRPTHVAVTPDGRVAFVTNAGEDSLTVIDASARRPVATVPVGAFPVGIALSPDGREAWVANLKGGTVSVVEVETRKEMAQIAVGRGPAQVAFAPGRRFAIVALREENAVAAVDRLHRTVFQKVPVGPRPVEVVSAPSARFVLVASQGSRRASGGTISFIDPTTLAVSATVNTAAGAHGLALSEDGRLAYVTHTDANLLSVIDLDERKIIGTVETGWGPTGVTVKPPAIP